MLTLKIFGDKQDDLFVWSIVVVDSRRTLASADGTADTEAGAKMAMLGALTQLVEKLEFRPVDEEEVS